MAKSFKNQLSGQIGEHLVVAELGRREIVATPFAGNVPDFDVLAYANGKSLAIQVKSQKEGSISVNADKYLDLHFEGDVQTIKGTLNDLDRDLIFVLVKIGKKSGEDRFYIFTQGVVQDLVRDHHAAFLNKHGGIRPRNPRSTHCSYHIEDLEEFEDNWDLIIQSLGSN